MADLPLDESTEVTIRDSVDNTREVTVTAAGALKVDGSAVTQPVSVVVVTPLSFSATMIKTAIGTTELNALFLKNPAASGKTLIIKQIMTTDNHTVANSWVRWRVYSNPTTSANGAAVTAGKMQVGLATNAVATPFNTPTSSALGQQLLDDTSIAGQTTIQYFDREFTVAANNTLLVTATGDAAGRSGTVTIIWTEE